MWKIQSCEVCDFCILLYYARKSVTTFSKSGNAFPRVKPVFHFIISPPPAKNFDIEIIFLRSCVAEDTCSAGPVVENFRLLFDLTLTARKNN